MSAMRIGLSLPTSGPLASSAFLRAFARSCEDLGYDGLWTSDHMTWTADQAAHHFPVGSVEAWRDPVEPRQFDPMATLAYLAGCTTTVRLGTAVLVLPTRNPVVLARQAASLDELSGGRLTLGVGVGGTAFADAEMGAVGAQGLRRRRGRVTDEWIDVMRGVWTRPTCTYAGEFIDVVDASIYPKPQQEGGPPILIGGDSPTALARVARRGDGSIVSRLEPADVGRRRHELAELAAPHGRSGMHFHLAVLRWLSIADDDRTAADRAEATLSRMTRGGRPIGDDVRLVGAPARLRDVVAAYVESGVDELILQVVGASERDVLESLRRFREDVLDQVRVPGPAGRGR